jgi:hypothetical protein
MKSHARNTGRYGRPMKKRVLFSVSHLPFKLSKNYGRLSQIFHTAGAEYLDCFAELDEGEVASYLPVYRGDWSPILLAVHVAHSVVLAEEIVRLQQDLFPSRPADASVSADLLSIAPFWLKRDFGTFWFRQMNMSKMCPSAQLM